MAVLMENLGAERSLFTLSGPPPVTFATKSGRSGTSVPVFQPYREDLPLQSGYYSFVVDDSGRLRVIRGNTSSHASLVRGGRVASAGMFRIGRSGRLAEVFCQSFDYRIRYRDHCDRAVVYVVELLARHPALDASPHLVFHFSKGVADNFKLDYFGNPIDEDAYNSKVRLSEEEGAGQRKYNCFTSSQIARFIRYKPQPPPRTHGVKIDQDVSVLEDEGITRPLYTTDPAPFFGSDNKEMWTGRVNFVIDAEGRLILGMKHHHALSGGHPVGGAGHLAIDDSGVIQEIQLNFSGHYRPPLTAEYARYVYRNLISHPLLSFSDSCEIKGRKFDEVSYMSSVVRFRPEELRDDDPSLEEYLELVDL
ncbi:MAG: hypothetical protein ACP5XB_02765 [Isosphaeraceae bacterium]